MDPEESVAAGYAVVDWIADYWRTLEQRPVTCRTRRARSPPPCPGRPSTASRSATPATGPDLTAPGSPTGSTPRFRLLPANTSGPSGPR